MVDLIKLVIFASFVFICCSQCAPGCGTQDYDENSVDVLPCDMMANEINQVVLAQQNSAQCRQIRINKKRPRRIRTCNVRRRVSPIDSTVLFSTTIDNGTAYRLTSPYFYNASCYEDGIYCAYHAFCPNNSLLYYRLTAHDIEDQTGNGCLDQLEIQKRASSGFLKSCGTVSTGAVKLENLETSDGIRSRRSSFLVNFLSGRRCRGRGFFLWVLCIANKSENVSGCAREGMEGQSGPTSFNVNFNVVSHMMRSRFITLPRGSTFRYRNNRIEFIGLNFFVDRIYSLLVFDYEEGLFLYCRESQRVFTGLGRVRIRNGLAMFIDDSEIDPSFHPTNNQHTLIGQFLTQLMPLFRSESYTVSDDDVVPGNYSSLPLSHLQRDQVSGLQNATFLCEQANILKNSCNAITRFTADLYNRLNCP